MRILFLTQWFQPEPFFKGLPFVKALQEKGHKVNVLTGFPNYPGGKVYSGYHVRLYQREALDGIIVHRIMLYPSHNRSAFHRIINYLSFSLSSFLLSPWLVKKPDVIYVYNLVTLGPTAFLLRLIFGSKVILDVQDLWPESVAASRMLVNKGLLNFLNIMCDWIYRRTDHLVVLSPGFKKNLIDRGVAPERIAVIYNWCDEASIRMEDTVSLDFIKPPAFTNKFVVLFAGAMGLVQGLDTLLDCAALCRESFPDIQFALIGGGVEKSRLQKRAKEMGLDNITFLPPRPMSMMGEVFALADALIVHLKDDALFLITIPSKTQAYLYAGKPIIMAMHGDAAELVRNSGAGILCEPENPRAMMEAIKNMYNMQELDRRKMGQYGREFYIRNLSFKEGVKKFEDIFLSCLE